MQDRKMGSIIFLLILSFLLAAFSLVYSHCEIPCGIYDDEMRVEMIQEHITTIEKSINMITKLSQGKEINYNQLVRWVTNKENHAVEIQSIVSSYFIAQRIKPVPEEDKGYKEYIKQLTLAHEIIVLAMKTKQSTDLENVEGLRKVVKKFGSFYMDDHDHRH